MKYLALALVFINCVVAPVLAQELPRPSPEIPAGNSTSVAPSSRPMTDREQEEMRAKILMARKEYEDAIKVYGDLLRSDPKNAMMLNTVGIAYQQLGDASHAEHFYKQALRADSKFANALNNLGALEYSKNHYGKAIKYYKKALAAGSEDGAVVYSNLGFAYYANHEFPNAMDAFGKALGIDPEIFARKGGEGPIVQQRSAPDPGALYFLVAKSYARAGDAEHAAHFLKMARDDGYKDFTSAKKDPDFARVIKDPRVQQVFLMQPAYADDDKKRVPPN